MPFDWVIARSALSDWIESTIGIRAVDMNGPQQWGGSLDLANQLPVHALCSLIQTRTIGVDEIYLHYDETAEINEEFTQIIRGMRELVWTIIIESRSSNAGEDATTYCEMIRSLLRARTAKTMMKSSWLGLRKIGDTIDMSAQTKRDRVLSAARIDVSFHAYVEVFADKYGFIEHVFVESSLEKPSGVLADDGLQIIGDMMS